MTRNTHPAFFRAAGLFGLLVAVTVTAVGDERRPAAGEAPRFADVPEEGEVRFQPLPAERHVPAPFRQEPHKFPFQTEPTGTSGSVRVYKVRFPSPLQTEVEANNTVHTEYFQPDGDGPHPGVVVLHILDGRFVLSRMVARSLAQKGVAALFVKLPFYGERRSEDSPRRMLSLDPRETMEGMRQGVLDIRRAAAWLADRPEIDAKNLGVTGISLGGIMSALAAPAEPRFRKVAVYLAGGNLGEMVWSHPHPLAAEFRRHWRSRGGTKETFLELAAPFDPVTYGHLLEDRNVLIVAAQHDRIIPPEHAKKLWKSMDERPTLIWLDAGHLSAVKYLFREMQRLGRFFNRGETELPATGGE